MNENGVTGSEIGNVTGGVSETDVIVVATP
jgi:hypothetical protein